MVQHGLVWGNILFDLSNDEFRKAFFNGRRYYYSDIHSECPERAVVLVDLDVVSQIVCCDRQTGRYHFDIEGIEHPLEFLGIFLGYAVAPFFPETLEEQVQRLEKQKEILHISQVTMPSVVASPEA